MPTSHIPPCSIFGGLVLVELACGQPPAEGSSTATTDEPGSTSTVSLTDGVDSSSTSAETSSGSTGTEPTEDHCLPHPAEACPEECTLVHTYSQIAGSCALDLSDETLVCASVEPFSSSMRNTFYQEIDGELRFALRHQPCAVDTPRQPTHFLECMGAPGEPAPCKCFCGAQGCPWDVDLQTLEDCGLPSPCGDVVLNDTGTLGTYDLCVLAALRDRVPGAYGWDWFRLFSQKAWVFVDGSEQVQLVYSETSDQCTSLPSGTWWPTRMSTLKPPEWFDACVTDPTPSMYCRLPLAWFDAWEEQPAACP